MGHSQSLSALMFTCRVFSGDDFVKIVHIMPGAGSTFYCQNCLRDSASIRHLRKLGHDVVAVPMYLPFSIDNPGSDSDAPIFCGAVKYYLGLRFPSLRLPRWVKRLLDSRTILKWAARQEGSTSAHDLEEMTISMLRGHSKVEDEEFNRLMLWLAETGKPDIIHLSSCLLIGLAERFKQELGVKIVCSLQDEDGWINAMGKKAADTVWDLMRKGARSVDAFTPVSGYYGDVMKKKLEIPADKIHVVRVGIDLEGYVQSDLRLDPPVIGYLSRMCESLGLGLLVDAFMIIRKNGRLGEVKMKVAGGMTAADRRYVSKLRRVLRSNGLEQDVEFISEFDRATRTRFLQQLSVMSVPVPDGEAMGSYLIEAMAAGVPVVQPEVGGFPELIAATRGGITYKPSNAETLASTLETLLLDKARLQELAAAGRGSVVDRFSLDRMAQDMLKVYRGLDIAS